MRHLLALLHRGTHGTQVEPSQLPSRTHEKGASVQTLRGTGTLGTRGTSEIEQADTQGILAHRTDVADAWHERLAICLEAGEARHIAEAEIGAAFVWTFMQLEVSP